MFYVSYRSSLTTAAHTLWQASVVCALAITGISMAAGCAGEVTDPEHDGGQGMQDAAFETGADAHVRDSSVVDPDSGTSTTDAGPQTRDTGTSSDVGPMCIPVAEMCNGLDDDCNGTPDNGVEPVACGNGTGACSRGTRECQDGSLGTCMGAVGPSPETCNGLDDDCNGTVDNGIAAVSCGSNRGECMSGTIQCRSGSLTSCIGEVRPRTEIEDGLDNDCDGSTDEGFPCLSGRAQQNYNILNTMRRGMGLGVMRCDRELRDVAQGHADFLCSSGATEPTHVGRGGSREVDRLRAAGVSFTSFAENVGARTTSAQVMHDAWMNSPSHRAPMVVSETRLNRVGVAYAACGGRQFWVQLFAL